MKRPSFQFYPSDWLRDTALRSCSMGARGLWMDMLCYMHEGNPYGHLKVGDKVILADNLARMVGETLEVVEGWLKELKQAGVYDLTSEGVICSRRMIRDENLRKIRAEGGKLGGNPALKVADKVNLKVVNKDKQNPTPSSSSSSSKDKNNTSADADFEQFWKVWPSSPRKMAKLKCLAVWKRKNLGKHIDQIVANIKALKTSKQWVDGFEPAPLTYLNQDRWADEVIVEKPEPAADDWMKSKKFARNQNEGV